MKFTYKGQRYEMDLRSIFWAVVIAIKVSIVCWWYGIDKEDIFKMVF